MLLLQQSRLDVRGIRICWKIGFVKTKIKCSTGSSSSSNSSSWSHWQWWQ